MSEPASGWRVYSQIESKVEKQKIQRKLLFLFILCICLSSIWRSDAASAQCLLPCGWCVHRKRVAGTHSDVSIYASIITNVNVCQSTKQQQQPSEKNKIETMIVCTSEVVKSSWKKHQELDYRCRSCQRKKKSTKNNSCRFVLWRTYTTHESILHIFYCVCVCRVPFI